MGANPTEKPNSPAECRRVPRILGQALAAGDRPYDEKRLHP